MPTSDAEGKDWSLARFKRHLPNTVTDIGPGEGTCDCPIVRQIDLLPGAVIEIRLHIGNPSAGISFRPHKLARRILDELIAGGKNPLLDDGRWQVVGTTLVCSGIQR